MILDFQLGTSSKAHKILGKFAGRVDADDEDDENKSKKENPKAPFEKMADAYLFAMMLGLSRVKKTIVKNRKNYAHINSIQGDLDIATLLRLLGEDGDTESKDAAKKAIEEYATWGLLHMDENNTTGVDDYRLANLFEKPTE